MKNITILLALACCLIAGQQRVTAAEISKPNIIVIFCDDLGYGDLGCYGSEKNKTPHLDRMAAEGMRFTDFYVTCGVCSPSRSSLMTGCYSQRVSLAEGPIHWVLMPKDHVGLNPDEITIAEILKAQGYATACIGKWHLGDQPEFLPTRQGFDSYFGIPYSNDMKPPGRVRNTDRYHPPLPLLKDETVIELEPDQSQLTFRFTEAAIKFINQNKEQPFFLYLPHMYVHLPLHVPEKWEKKAANGKYGAEVEVIDWSTGQILKTLKELGIDENTLVLFTSDNGSNRRNGGSNAPLRGGKASTWEGGMREPCIVRWPGKIPSGSVCRELASTMDLLPTFAHLAGGDAPADRIIDGKDIQPLLFGKAGAKTPHEAFYYYKRYTLDAVRSGDWKLHLKTRQLYNLNGDVGEQRNVYADHADVVKKLTALAEQARSDLGDNGQPGKNVRPPGRVENPKILTKP